MKSRSLLLIVLGLTLSGWILAGEADTCVPKSGVEPYVHDLQNPACSNLGVCSITDSCAEYKLEGEDISEGDHTHDTEAITVHLTLREYKEDDGEVEWLKFDWEATKPIRAVIVKAGTQANVYEYFTPRTSDTCMSSPSNTGISHITFCYVPSPPPQLEVTVSGLTNLEITQLRIRNWAATGDFKQSLGDLTVSVTATVNYQLWIYYTLPTEPSPSFLDDPLSFEDLNGGWTTIPRCPTEEECPSKVQLPDFTGAPTPTGEETHTYPVCVDLTLLGDRKAGESFTFTVHVMATSPGI